MIATGYVLISVIILGLIFLSEKVLIGFIGEEYCRKILHIGVFAVFPIANVFWDEGSIHFLIICAVFSFATIFLFYTKKLKTDQRENRYPGICYYALSLLTLSVICYFYNFLTPLFGVAFIALAIGDGFATLVGHAVKGPKIYKNKTYAGFLACFIATFAALLIYNFIHQGFLSLLSLLFISLFVSIVELIDWGLDNLAIPIATFLLTALILYFPNALIALAIFEAVFVIAFGLKIIEYYGALLAAAIGFLFFYFAGIKAFLFIVGCYAIMLTVSTVSKILKNDISSVVKKTGVKDLTEIFVNGVWAILAIILFAITQSKLFLVVALLSMSAGFVDSLASDVGTLSRFAPYDPIRRKRVEKGVSGGVTVLGCAASLIGAVLFATAVKFICELPTYSIISMAVFLYAGCITDTILGSLIQVKYKCSICGHITEKETHCNTSTTAVQGVIWINNDVVNFVSGLVVFLLSFLLFVIL